MSPKDWLLELQRNKEKKPFLWLLKSIISRIPKFAPSTFFAYTTIMEE
jgi:hypothetical protein